MDTWETSQKAVRLEPTPVIDTEAVFVPAFGAVEADQLGAAASASAVIQHDRGLFAFGADSRLDGTEMLVFFFEIIDVDRDRPHQNNHQK